VARRPLCEKCLIADLCKWPGKTVNAAAPIRKGSDKRVRAGPRHAI